jgi:hypothetical protein
MASNGSAGGCRLAFHAEERLLFVAVVVVVVVALELFLLLT